MFISYSWISLPYYATSNNAIRKLSCVFQPLNDLKCFLIISGGLCNYFNQSEIYGILAMYYRSEILWLFIAPFNNAFLPVGTFFLYLSHSLSKDYNGFANFLFYLTFHSDICQIKRFKFITFRLCICKKYMGTVKQYESSIEY